MVNTRTDAELAVAVQAAVDAMLPHIREQVADAARNLEILQTRGIRMETSISRPLSRVVIGVTEFRCWTRPKEQRSAIPPIYQF
ncbi:hypothetical protein Tco_0996418 [Tanacetum coccineum]